MKQTQTMVAIALCTLTGAAFAQSTPPQSPMSTPSATSPATATPPSAVSPPATTTAPAATTPAPTGSTTQMPSRSQPADTAFRSLDKANRGYLSKSDLQGLDGISFEQADVNKDGRVTTVEFARAWSAKK